MQPNAKLAQLQLLLEEAEALAAQFSGGYSTNFLGAEAFYEALSKSIQKLKRGRLRELNKLWHWFAPTCDWDDFISMEGLHLGNPIFELVSELRRKPDR